MNKSEGKTTSGPCSAARRSGRFTRCGWPAVSSRWPTSPRASISYSSWCRPRPKWPAWACTWPWLRWPPRWRRSSPVCSWPILSPPGRDWPPTAWVWSSNRPRCCSASSCSAACAEPQRATVDTSRLAAASLRVLVVW